MGVACGEVCRVCQFFSPMGGVLLFFCFCGLISLGSVKFCGSSLSFLNFLIMRCLFGECQPYVTCFEAYLFRS